MLSRLRERQGCRPRELLVELLVERGKRAQQTATNKLSKQFRPKEQVQQQVLSKSVGKPTHCGEVSCCCLELCRICGTRGAYIQTSWQFRGQARCPNTKRSEYTLYPCDKCISHSGHSFTHDQPSQFWVSQHSANRRGRVVTTSRYITTYPTSHHTSVTHFKAFNHLSSDIRYRSALRPALA